MGFIGGKSENMTMAGGRALPSRALRADTRLDVPFSWGLPPATISADIWTPSLLYLPATRRLHRPYL